jgi:hypothetical protein
LLQVAAKLYNYTPAAANLPEAAARSWLQHVLPCFLHVCLQDCPGYGATLDPAGYLEALLTFLFTQQKDHDQLHGSRGMPK